MLLDRARDTKSPREILWLNTIKEENKMQEVKQDKEPGIEVLRQGCNTMVERNIECEQHGGNCCANGYCCQKFPDKVPLG